MDSLTHAVLQIAEGEVLPIAPPARATPQRANLLLVIEDQPYVAPRLEPICDYLGVILRPVTSAVFVSSAMEDYRPLAIMCDFEGEHQDGGNVLKSVATLDPSLPVMVLTHGNAVWQGAVAALAELLKLQQIHIPVDDPTSGELVEFLARAAREVRSRRRSEDSVSQAPLVT